MMHNSEFIAYFEQTYSKSIAISHIGYLKERCSNRSLLIYGIGEEASDLKRYLYFNGIYTEAYIDEEFYNQKKDDVDVISLIDLVYMKNGSYFVILARNDENYGISRQNFLIWVLERILILHILQKFLAQMNYFTMM